MKELQKHLDAFEYYFQCKQSGHNTTESIRLVKSKCNVSEKTLYHWKKEFDWDGREAIRSLEINNKIQEKTNNSIVDNKIQYLGIYHRLLKKLADKGYNIDINNINDLNMVIKGALLIQDQPTENIKEQSIIFKREFIDEVVDDV